MVLRGGGKAWAGGCARFAERVDDEQEELGGNDGRRVSRKRLLRKARFVVLVVRGLFKNKLGLLQNLLHHVKWADATVLDGHHAPCHQSAQEFADKKDEV